MRFALTSTRRMVIKVGTRVVARPDGRLALGRLGQLIEQIAVGGRRGLGVGEQRQDDGKHGRSDIPGTMGFHRLRGGWLGTGAMVR